MRSIDVGRFRIRGGGGGGQGLEYWGGGGRGGPNSQQAHDTVTTSMRIDVISTSCAYEVFNKSVPNICISHLKILYYTKFKHRIERNSFASTFKSN